MTKSTKATRQTRPALLRCPECGGAVRPHAAAGRRLTYKNLAGLGRRAMIVLDAHAWL
jgi:hypothetical protein